MSCFNSRISVASNAIQTIDNEEFLELCTEYFNKIQNKYRSLELHLFCI